LNALDLRIFFKQEFALEIYEKISVTRENMVKITDNISDRRHSAILKTFVCYSYDNLENHVIEELVHKVLFRLYGK
jgi:hypothetical protein